IVCEIHEGVGIHAENRRSVRVKNLALSGFYHGLRFDHCHDVHVEKLRVRDTYEIEGIDTFLYLWQPIEKVYGGAVLLHDVQGGSVRGCDLQHQMIGVLMYGCTDVTVEDNNASFNSGWGVYLSGSNENIVRRNQLDFCNRVFRRPENGSIRVEADAAAIVMVKSSCRNQIVRNSCLCGGDGIFVAGFTPEGERTPCDDNLFEENDCRLSPNNAIESTFSRGNIFRRNDCSRSNYGFWMGYSWDNVLEDNLIELNRFVGIAIEHGHGFVIRNNRILNNGEGIRLFTRGGPVLQSWPGWEVSYDFSIEDNRLENNNVAFNGYTGAEIEGIDGRGYRIVRNQFRNNRIGARFYRVHESQIEDNVFADNVEQAVLLVGEPGVALGTNEFSGNHADVVKREASLGSGPDRHPWKA
ncbi:MAG: right-handed parallel beta-helix repeat-containing protein, partial [Anaerolineae bacterium]|nr:right-handed parallel beta-helix repeat-containing protein [Anaerolineae bacterium]